MKRVVSVLLSLLLPNLLVADEAIPAKTLADIKGATVFIKMKAGPLQGTGSGFVIRVDGTTAFIVTNHHVAVPDVPRFPKAEELTVVFHSGTKQEQSCKAELLASDKERDLAVLKVTGKELPAPLDLAQKVELAETLPVFMFGFPFGQALSLTKGNPAVTVGKGTISSIRLNDREEVGFVQIDGDLNPGNSGGPVVDSKGRLVGVAVAKIRGTRIGLAIPPTELTRMLNGRVAGLKTRSTRVNATTSDVEIEVPLIDPLGKIKEVEVYYQLARDLKEKPKPDKETLWTLMAGGERAKLTLDGQKATGKVRLTAKDKGLVPFSFQVACVTGEGKKQITAVTPVEVDFGEVTVVTPGGGLDRPPPAVFIKDKLVTAVPTIGDALLAANGRYLILHLSDKRKLLVWDVYQSKVARELPLAGDQVKMASSLDKLVLILPAQKLIQRYNLKTFERETTQVLRVKGTVTGLAMGHASSGPLLVAMTDERGNETGQFLDPLTLQSLEFDWGDGKMPGFTGDFLRASANGQVFTARQGVGGEPHSCVSIVINGRKAKAYSGWMSGSLLLPMPDGQHVCTETGIFDQQLKPVFPRSPGNTVVDPFLPAHQGGIFLRLEKAGEGLGKMSIYLSGREKPIGVVEEVEGYIGQPIAYGKIPNPLMHDRRVFYVPDAKMLITVPLSNDRIVCRTLDVDKLMEKAGFDYLIVSSQPVTTARENTLYTYQVTAKSNKGGIKYKLESGPKGMRLSPQGLVEWEVPKKSDRAEHDVVIAITDAGGQEALHSFAITIE